MKKILTASLVAIMAVTAANAEIASVGYVDDVVGALDVSDASGTGNVVTSVTQENGKVVVTKEFNAASNKDLTTLADRVATAEGTLSGLTSGDASVDKKIEDAVSALENGSIKDNADDISALQGTVATLETKTDANAKLTEAKGYTDTKVGEVDTALTSYKTEMTTTLGDYAKTSAVESEIATAKGEAIDAAAADATTKANAAQQAAIAAIGTADFVIKKNAADTTGTKFNANAKTDVELNLGLATVATSGSYNDLSGKPTIPTTVAQLTDAGDYVKDTELTTTLGSYVTSGALEQKGYATTAYADAKVDNAVIDDDDAATKTAVAPSVAQVAVYVGTAETDAVKAAKDYTDSKFSGADAQISDLTSRMEQVEGGVGDITADYVKGGESFPGATIPTLPNECKAANAQCSLVSNYVNNQATLAWEVVKY